MSILKIIFFFWSFTVLSNCSGMRERAPEGVADINLLTEILRKPDRIDSVLEEHGIMMNQRNQVAIRNFIETSSENFKDFDIYFDKSRNAFCTEEYHGFRISREIVIKSSSNEYLNFLFYKIGGVWLLNDVNGLKERNYGLPI